MVWWRWIAPIDIHMRYMGYGVVEMDCTNIHDTTNDDDIDDASLMMIFGDDTSMLLGGRTMRLHGALRDPRLHILLDTGSTHNIIDELFAR